MAAKFLTYLSWLNKMSGSSVGIYPAMFGNTTKQVGIYQDTKTVHKKIGGKSAKNCGLISS